MKLVDANVLLYAVNSDSKNHESARTWLDGGLVGDEVIGLPWVCLLAFARLATHRTIFPAPMTTDQALNQVEEWLSAPAATECLPGARHISLLRQTLNACGGSGNLVNDAHLAALALEHKATIVTYNTDFVRFPDVPWRTPDQLVT